MGDVYLPLRLRYFFFETCFNICFVFCTHKLHNNTSLWLKCPVALKLQFCDPEMSVFKQKESLFVSNKIEKQALLFSTMYLLSISYWIGWRQRFLYSICSVCLPSSYATLYRLFIRHWYTRRESYRFVFRQIYKIVKSLLTQNKEETNSW